MNENEILIIGAKGQLGSDLCKKYPNAIAVDYNELDITDRSAVETFEWEKFKVIINAAAFTNVDGAETDDGRILAWKINASGPRLLSEMALKHDLTFIHISSDYVFDGQLKNHNESEDFSPLSVYGASKAAGDLSVSLTPKHYILRTSWVVGNGKNFVKTMLELAEKGVKPNVVNDQFGRLTFTSELVSAIDFILTNHPHYDTYNISNSGAIKSWAEIAKQVYRISDKYPNNVTGISTEEYYQGKDNIAPRPTNSNLNLDKIIAAGFVPTDWQAEMENYIRKELTK
jgi:dTDP-4-dehydrorhamnose 3,5-epimerase